MKLISPLSALTSQTPKCLAIHGIQCLGIHCPQCTYWDVLLEQFYTCSFLCKLPYFTFLCTLFGLSPIINEKVQNHRTILSCRLVSSLKHPTLPFYTPFYLLYICRFTDRTHTSHFTTLERVLTPLNKVEALLLPPGKCPGRNVGIPPVSHYSGQLL